MADVFFYVQHLLGIGHQMRASRLAQAITASGLELDYVSGGIDNLSLDLGSARSHQLPAIRSRDARFSDLIDDQGQPVREALWTIRQNILTTLFERYNPALLLIEGFPFARRKFSREIMPLLEKAKKKHIPVFCSIRDILIRPDRPEKRQMALLVATDFFDQILVHGDQNFITLEESWPEIAKINHLLHYTGYVAPIITRPSPPLPLKHPEKNEIVISAGGGGAGEKLLMTAALLSTGSRQYQWRFLIGPNFSKTIENNLKYIVKNNAIIEKNRTDFIDILNRSCLSISQAGYNTVMDLCLTGTPALLVPFGDDRENEQRLRARFLARSGNACILEEADLTPESLAAKIEETRQLPRQHTPPFQTGGAEKTARHIMRWLAK